MSRLALAMTVAGIVLLWVSTVSVSTEMDEINARIRARNAELKGQSPQKVKIDSSNSGGSGMTTEEANEYYGRINRGANAQADQSAQPSRRCEPSAAANWEAQQAEDALRVAKNSERRTGPRAVREAQANLEAARDRRDNACDPAASQQARDAREAKRAAEENARKQAEDQRRLQRSLDEANRKLDNLKWGN